MLRWAGNLAPAQTATGVSPGPRPLHMLQFTVSFVLKSASGQRAVPVPEVNLVWASKEDRISLPYRPSVRQLSTAVHRTETEGHSMC